VQVEASQPPSSSSSSSSSSAAEKEKYVVVLRNFAAISEEDRENKRALYLRLTELIESLGTQPFQIDERKEKHIRESASQNIRESTALMRKD